MKLFELIKTLNAAYGPSGDEQGICDVITRLAAPFSDEIYTDTMGNLIVHKKGSGPKVMFAAHMDSIGLVVTHIEKDGFLRVGRLGGIGPKEAAYTPFRFRNGLRGAFLPEEKADFGKLKLDECYLDIGACSGDQAKESVQIGDTAIYDAPTFCTGDNVTSPYLDNRISCAILLAALEQITENTNDLYFVFTVQEEVGLRGAKTAAWAIDPDYSIAVDVTDVNDAPGCEKTGTVQLGHGAAVKVMDSSVICHPKVVNLLEQIAKDQKIRTQRDILLDGGTDAGAIHTTRTGVLTGGISVPCRYIHTPVEAANLTDAEECTRLTVAFAQYKLEPPSVSHC